ncbi:MAG: hypothetical protein ACR2QT_03555 [Woeseiaceae bacterium]
MKTKTKLIALEMLGVLFDLIWVGALLVFIYFLYGALAKGTPWPYLGWMFAVTLIARQSAVAMKDAKQRIDYVDQLLERGYEQGHAEAAWRIFSKGGSNLLSNLKQAENGQGGDT